MSLRNKSQAQDDVGVSLHWVFPMVLAIVLMSALVVLTTIFLMADDLTALQYKALVAISFCVAAGILAVSILLTDYVRTALDLVRSRNKNLRG